MKNDKDSSLASTGEKLATSLLEKKGYDILQRNFHSRYGEIDIIAKLHEHIIFVEVKTRTSLNRDLALESVSLQKQRRIIKTAHHFLQLHQEYCDYMVRYDIILMFYHSSNDTYSWEHLEDAYSVGAL